jgi:hypothetical protein
MELQDFEAIKLTLAQKGVVQAKCGAKFELLSFNHKRHRTGGPTMASAYLSIDERKRVCIGCSLEVFFPPLHENKESQCAR